MSKKGSYTHKKKEGGKAIKLSRNHNSSIDLMNETKKSDIINIKTGADGRKSISKKRQYGQEALNSSLMSNTYIKTREEGFDSDDSYEKVKE